MVRGRADAVPARALALSLLALILLQFALLDTGSLTATVALAATAAAGSALSVCALISARGVPTVPPTRIRTAIRDRARRTAFLAQRDPDARGRTRPRAPGAALQATPAQAITFS